MHPQVQWLRSCFVTWQLQSKRQTECEQVRGRFKCNAVTAGSLAALKKFCTDKKIIAAKAEANLKQVMTSYWLQRDPSMQCQVLVAELGVFMKKAGKAITQIEKGKQEDDPLAALLQEFAKAEAHMREKLQSKPQACGHAQLPKQVLALKAEAEVAVALEVPASNPALTFAKGGRLIENAASNACWKGLEPGIKVVVVDTNNEHDGKQGTVIKVEAHWIYVRLGEDDKSIEVVRFKPKSLDSLQGVKRGSDGKPKTQRAKEEGSAKAAEGDGGQKRSEGAVPVLPVPGGLAFTLANDLQTSDCIRMHVRSVIYKIYVGCATGPVGLCLVEGSANETKMLIAKEDFTPRSIMLIPFHGAGEIHDTKPDGVSEEFSLTIANFTETYWIQAWPTLPGDTDKDPVVLPTVCPYWWSQDVPSGPDVVPLVKETFAFDASLSAEQLDSKKVKSLHGAKRPSKMSIKLPCFTNANKVPKGTRLCLSTATEEKETDITAPKVEVEATAEVEVEATAEVEAKAEVEEVAAQAAVDALAQAATDSTATEEKETDSHATEEQRD